MKDAPVHSLSLTGRKELTLEGVQHVETFDETEIVLKTCMGTLILKGEGLHITSLNLETGKLAAEGFFTALIYQEGREKGKAGGRGILKRILK